MRNMLPMTLFIILVSMGNVSELSASLKKNCCDVKRWSSDNWPLLGYSDVF